MPLLKSSADLLFALKKLGYLREDSPPFWWKGAGEFEVVVGAILTQQTKWENVQKSLLNLKKHNRLSLQTLNSLDHTSLSLMIKPSGFYNKKAKVLKDLTKAILRDFGDFDTFKMEVSREWLLEQKGVGRESADSILCYGCKREVMVVDNYTNRLLEAFGYEFESYDELQEWVVEGIQNKIKDIKSLYKGEVNSFTIYSRFHGKIVEYMKENFRAKSLNIAILEEVL
jgi:endonuclease-3 related protein